MKLAFVGKGGSGKTTMASLFARRAAALGHPVMAVDADINQHLAAALGIDSAAADLSVLGEHMNEIKEYLRGTNPLITSADFMIKTTPPGPGSRLLTVGESNPIFDALFTEHDGIRFAATGDFKDEDLGKRCYHSKTGAVELILSHLIDNEDEIVVVDMVAGAEIFGSGMFTRFDAIVVAVEPTTHSMGVYRQVADYAKTYDMNVWVIANKIEDEADRKFLSDHLGNAQLIGWFEKSAYLKAAARGELKPLTSLEKENVAVLDALLQQAFATPKNWKRSTELTHEFHCRAVDDWGGRPDANLHRQIVPGFNPAEYLLSQQQTVV